MSDGVRFDFINYSATDATVSVTTSDAIVYKELLATTPVKTPAGNLQSVAAGTKNLVVAAGRLFGFSSDHSSVVTPISGSVTIIVASGKDPWPPVPPLAPPALAAVTDWNERFHNFNTASAAAASDRPALAGQPAEAIWTTAGDGAPTSVPPAGES